MSQPDYYHKRIERPLLVQTTKDAGALSRARVALQTAIDEITAQEKLLDTPQHLVVARHYQSNPQFENSVADTLYRKTSGLMYEIMDSHGMDREHRAVQEIAGTVFRTIWNEAIELAAQVTGGAEGTLIRDLKEDRNHNSKSEAAAED